MLLLEGRPGECQTLRALYGQVRGQVSPPTASVGLLPPAYFCGSSGPGFAILVFRGTDTGEPKDLMADLKIRTRPLDGGPEVHRGFLDALDGVWTDMRPFLADLETAGTPVWLTGHSLGGCLLAAWEGLPGSGHRLRELTANASQRYLKFLLQGIRARCC